MVECLVSLRLQCLLIVYFSSLEVYLIDKLFQSDLVYHTHNISFHRLDNFAVYVCFHNKDIISVDAPCFSILSSVETCHVHSHVVAVDYSDLFAVYILLHVPLVKRSALSFFVQTVHLSDILWSLSIRLACLLVIGFV